MNATTGTVILALALIGLTAFVFSATNNAWSLLLLALLFTINLQDEE